APTRCSRSRPPWNSSTGRRSAASPSFPRPKPASTSAGRASRRPRTCRGRPRRRPPSRRSGTAWAAPGWSPRVASRCPTRSATRPPTEQTALRDRLGSARLVTAFRITLPNPLWSEADNVALAASLLAGTFIAPGETVSVIGLIGPLTKERGYGDGPGYADGRLVPVQAGGVCKIGTAVYNVAVYGGLTVLERHPHSMIVPYVHPGRDAAIATGHKDVRVRNDYGRPVGLWAAFADNTLFVALYGDVDAPS